MHATGPLTPQGKAASSQNNRQHGLATKNLIVLPQELDSYREIETQLRDEIQPAGPLEDFAFRKLITARWQMERAQQKEAEILSLDASPDNESRLLAYQRYYLRWEGSYNRALKEIRQLQTDRALQAVTDEMAGQPSPETFPPLVDLLKIEQRARRTRLYPTSDTVVQYVLGDQLAALTLRRQILALGVVPEASLIPQSAE